MLRKVKVVCTVALLLVLHLWLGRQAYLASLRPPTLPELHSIASIKAKVHVRERPYLVEFEVPKTQWDELLRILLNARNDSFAAKWQVYGDLMITHQDGSTLGINVYRRDHPDDNAVFSVSTAQGVAPTTAVEARVTYFEFLVRQMLGELAYCPVYS
jgi:hypothetical protein